MVTVVVDRLKLDGLNGSLFLRRTDAGNFSVTCEAANSVGDDSVTFALIVRRTYGASLEQVRPNVYSSAEPVRLAGRVTFERVIIDWAYYLISQ